jgi:hypothetical protein
MSGPNDVSAQLIHVSGKQFGGTEPSFGGGIMGGKSSAMPQRINLSGLIIRSATKGG